MSLCLYVMCIVSVGIVHWALGHLVPGAEYDCLLVGMCLKTDGETRVLYCLASSEWWWETLGDLAPI